MSTLQRYTLFQIPGWIIGGIVLAGCWELELISVRTAMFLFGLLLLKDIVAYPLVHRAYEDRSASRLEDLIGSNGVVQRELAPAGFVRIRGELWRAEIIADTPPLSPGTRVIVRNTRGLTLIVEESAE